MRRSAFFAASAAPFALPLAARAQTLAKIRVASAPNDDLIASLWALETGAFRKAGLDVDLQKSNSGSAVAAAVAGGAVDVGKSSLVSLLAGRAKGFPFVIVAPSGLFTAETPFTAGIMVALDSPIKTGADCNGKIVGVAGLNDMTSIATQAWIDQNGGDSKTLKFIEVPTSAIPESIAAGRIDLGTVPNPTFGMAVTTGKVRALCAPLLAIGKRFMQAGYFSTADYAAKNRPMLAAFRKVIGETGAYANAHQTQMIPLISKFTGIDQKVLAQQPHQLCATTLDVKLIQPIVDVAIAYKAIPPGFDARQMFDPESLA